MEEADVIRMIMWAHLTTAMPRTICVVARRSRDPEATGSLADADTASCRPFGNAKTAPHGDGLNFDLTPVPAGPASTDMVAIDMFAGSLSRPRFDAERLAQAFAADLFFQVHPASEDR